MKSSLAFLENLTRETHQAESEVISMAFQTGIKQLWREHILGKYLRGNISRGEAIESVGIDWVELADRQRQAIMEDLAWALK
jgi:hypothetical protein